MTDPVLTYRLVEIEPRWADDKAVVILAEVYEHDGLYAQWRPFDGEYGYATIRADAGPIAVASIERQLRAMLAATARPVLHVDRDSLLIDWRPSA